MFRDNTQPLHEYGVPIAVPCGNRLHVRLQVLPSGGLPWVLQLPVSQGPKSLLHLRSTGRLAMLAAVKQNTSGR